MQTGSRWVQKPIRGTPLDRTHSLCSGLQGFYALNENGGGILWDATGNLRLSSNGYGSNSPWSSAAMSGIVSIANMECFTAALPAWLQFPWPMSMAVGFHNIGVATYYSAMMSISYSSTITAPYDALTLGKDSNSNSARIATNNAGSQYTADVGTFVNGKDYVFSTSQGPTTQNTYINGVSVLATTNSNGNPTFGTPQLIIGSALPVGTNNFSNTLVYWGAWWNRALSAAEHALLGSNVNAIWQIFRPMVGIGTLAGAQGSAPPSTTYQPWIYGDQIQEQYG
jgi:hypothetical protein